ncbi:MAG: hypothetical protein R3F53_05680 [Gammaproteobacteria bacterium]
MKQIRRCIPADAGESLSKTRTSASYQLKSAESGRIPLSIELAAPSDEDLQAVKASQGFGKQTQISSGERCPCHDQPLDMTQLDWMPLADGGQAAVLTVRSPDAPRFVCWLIWVICRLRVELWCHQPAATPVQRRLTSLCAHHAVTGTAGGAKSVSG